MSARKQKETAIKISPLNVHHDSKAAVPAAHTADEADEAGELEGAEDESDEADEGDGAKKCLMVPQTLGWGHYRTRPSTGHGVAD